MWPIFQRELLMGARDPVFRHLRVGSGLMAWVGLALLVWSVEGTVGNVGGKIFQIFHVLWACVLLLLSIGLTAPVLVSERIGGTLGLLFLTSLRPFEVVGGKGLAALLRMTTLWLSGLPIGMVPFVMGSVTLFDAMFYATFQFAMVSCGLSAGLLFSAATKDRRSGLRGAMGVGLGMATIVLGVWDVFSLPLSWTPVWVRHLVGTVYALGAGGGVLLFTLFTSAAILGRRWREGSDTSPSTPAPDPVEAAEEAHWQHSGTVRSVPFGLFVSAVGTALLPLPGLILRHAVAERAWGGAAIWGVLGLAGILYTLKALELVVSRELALTYLRKP